MRVLFAGLFVFASMLGSVGIISSYYPDDQWPWWGSIVPIIALVVSMGISMYVFNSPGYRPTFSKKSLNEQLAELESQGHLLKQQFQASRTFSVEEYEDEGPHYFIELVDGRVLYLNGQYLYDYEEITDDPGYNQPRKFPCTIFEILRHKLAGYVVDIRCSGTVLEPEVVAPCFTKERIRQGIPEDGEIISDKSYEKIKLDLTSV